LELCVLNFWACFVTNRPCDSMVLLPLWRQFCISVDSVPLSLSLMPQPTCADQVALSSLTTLVS
jgi:hypothetical protein